MPPLDIVIDTDIGDDIDDALALALAVRSPELRLRGVTTVFRDAPRRAQLARHLLTTMGQGAIPVIAGCSKALLEPTDRNLGSQFQLLNGLVLDDGDAEQGHAIDFLIEAAREWGTPEQPLTLVPIGPLTNIALAFAKEPGLARRCRVVLMGGRWDGAEIEWNIRCDPEAAAMVFKSGADLSMVGLEVTWKCTLDAAGIAHIGAGAGPTNKLLAELIALWQKDNSVKLTLHDPLAVLSLFDDCLIWERKNIEIALHGSERGRMRAMPGEANARVAVAVDAERVAAKVLERLSA